ncbi:MAG: type III-B CRISPR module RAMP protein Cmr1, partial [Syntrophobacterales bacterium]|nr:type III-B CRISPR module RAMP protein Cmr1 [Syntrophobacterales bacterium]
WWYEAIVRGLDGYACDPTDENSRYKLDQDKFKRAVKSGKSVQEALNERVCPVCQLFGCGGWKRRFQFRIEDAPTTPLHFRTSDNTNKNWLKRVFGGESQNINNLKVFYGDIAFKFIIRGDDDYIRSQLIMLFNFISKYGGLGAKLQHGFGQIRVLEPESANDDTALKKGLKELGNKIQANEFSEGEKVNTPYSLENFVSLDYDLTPSSLKKFMQNDSHIGNDAKTKENSYIPCAFDLRYKGSGKFGMRKWLEDIKNWEHKEINMLMGVSEKRGEKLTDEDRASSRLCFGMPYKLGNGNYRLRIFGFAPPDILKPNDLKALCEEYMNYVFDKEYKLIYETLGTDIINGKGGTQ